MSYTYYQAKNQEDQVTEEELPIRLQNLNNKTSAISYNPMTFLTSFTGDISIGTNGKLNGNKIGAPDSFKYNDITPFIPVCDTAGVIEVGRYIDFHDASTTHDFYTRLMCVGSNDLEIAGTSSMRMSRIDVSIGMSLRPGNTLMKFTKSDNSTNLLTLDATTNIATFLGNIIAPNITTLENKTQAITYEVEEDKTIIANTTETGSLKVTYGTDTYTLSVGDSSVFTGSVTFNSTVNGYNIENEFSKLQYLSTMDDVTDVNGIFRASNLVGITYDADLNTTFFSGNLSSPNISNMNNNLSGIIYNSDDGTGNPLTEFTHSISIDGNITADNIGTMTTNMIGITYDSEESATRINNSLIVNGDVTADNITVLEDKTQNILRIPGTDEDPISYTEIDGVSFQTTLGRITNVEFTLSNITYDPMLPSTDISGNVTVGLLNGNNIGAPDIFRYDNETPFIPVIGSNGIMEVGNRIDFHRATNEEDYTAGIEVKSSNLLAVRHTNTAYAGDLEVGTTYYKNANGSSRLTTNQHSNIMWYNNTGTNVWIMDATSSGERWSVTRDNAAAAITRTTAMTYTAAITDPVTPANTTFTGNITSSECYAGRYHTNSTNSLPINSVSNASNWGAIRIVRTGLAQNTPCGFQFGRGNDSETMPNNYCAMYYIAPTADSSKGEIRIGVESEAFTSSTNCITFDTDTKETKFPANITAPNLTGITYNSNLLLQGSDYTAATLISNHLQIDLTGVTYKAHLGMRIHKYNLADTQEMMFQLGMSNTRAISFVYRYANTVANSQYRLDFAGRSAYICNYGDTKTEHEIKGNLKVYGTVTEIASKTITHYTKYEGEMKLGCFVESTGKIYRDPASKLSPYEDCITVVKLSTEYNNNIIGVCTEILNEEIKDEYNNIIQPAGNYCKYATHGDVLIKCVSATYSLGDILIPTTGGYAKKANNMEIIDAMTHMIPRLKVTSVETETLDSETVCAFITL